MARSQQTVSQALVFRYRADEQASPTDISWPDGQRRRVLQMRAADLDYVLKFFGLGIDRVMDSLNRRYQLVHDSSAAAMYIAVGNVSFDDCDMFTSSFG